MIHRFPIVALAILLTTFLAEDSYSNEINHAKFLAQRAALPALEGKDGLELRASTRTGLLKPGEFKLLPQQLFKGNTYQFWLASANIDSKLLLNIYNRSGKLMETEKINFTTEKSVVSIKVRPGATGMYYLRVALTKESEESQDWALIYAYK